MLKRINIQDTMESDLEIEQKKSKRRAIIIIILIIIILLLICFFYLFGKRVGKIGYEQTSNVPIDIIKITENDIDFNKIDDLNIFSNPEFEGKKMIAPRSHSSYDFKIENTTSNNIRYNIEMSEVNELDINMKYKLKLDNIYIVGNKNEWAEVEDLNINDIIVTANSRNIYTLEWYWEDAPNDTSIGEAVYAEYKLKINITSEDI